MTRSQHCVLAVECESFRSWDYSCQHQQQTAHGRELRDNSYLEGRIRRWRIHTIGQGRVLLAQLRRRGSPRLRPRWHRRRPRGGPHPAERNPYRRRTDRWQCQQIREGQPCSHAWQSSLMQFLDELDVDTNSLGAGTAFIMQTSPASPLKTIVNFSTYFTAQERLCLPLEKDIPYVPQLPADP